MSIQDYNIYELRQKYCFGWDKVSKAQFNEFQKHFTSKLFRLNYVTLNEDEVFNFNNFLFHFYNKERYNHSICNFNWELFDESEEELINNLEFNEKWSPEEQATYYMIKSRKHVKEKDYFKAISVIDEAIKINPDYYEALYLRGVYRHNNNHYRDASKDFKKIIAVNPLYKMRLSTLSKANEYFDKSNKKRFDALCIEIRKYFKANKYSKQDYDCFFKRCFGNALYLDYEISLQEFEDLKTIDSNLKYLKEFALNELKRNAKQEFQNVSKEVKESQNLDFLKEIESKITDFKKQFDVFCKENTKIEEIKRLFFRDTDYNFRSDYYLKRIEVEIRKIFLSDKHSNTYKRDNERRKSILNMRSFHLIDDILYSKKYVNHLKMDYFLKLTFQNEAYIEGGDFAFLGVNYGDKKKKITQKINVNSFFISKYPIGRSLSWIDALEQLNHRSICEGLTPCYKFNGKETTRHQRYQRREETLEIECNWEADGYRLPTVAEWHYAIKDYEYSIYKYGLVHTEGNEWLWDGINNKVKLSFDTLYNPHFDKGEYRVVTHTNQEVKRYNPDNENMNNAVVTNQHYLERNNAISFRYVKPIHRPEKMTMPYWLRGDNFHFDLRKILKDSLYYNGLNSDLPRSYFGYTHSFVLSEILSWVVDKPVEEVFETKMKDLKVIHEEFILFEDLGVEDWNIKIYPQKREPYNPNKENHVLCPNMEICKWIILEDEFKIRYSVLIINADGVSTHQALYLSNNIRPKFLIFQCYGTYRYYDIDRNNDRMYEHTIYYKDDTVPKYFVSYQYFEISLLESIYQLNCQHNSCDTVAPKHIKRLHFYSFDTVHSQWKIYSETLNIVMEYTGNQPLISKIKLI